MARTFAKKTIHQEFRILSGQQSQGWASRFPTECSRESRTHLFDNSNKKIKKAGRNGSRMRVTSFHATEREFSRGTCVPESSNNSEKPLPSKTPKSSSSLCGSPSFPYSEEREDAGSIYIASCHPPLERRLQYLFHDIFSPSSKCTVTRFFF